MRLNICPFAFGVVRVFEFYSPYVLVSHRDSSTLRNFCFLRV